MKSKIIWCTGASGTGKTVLNNKLQKHFEDLGYQVIRLESVSRSVCEEMNISSPKQLTEQNYFDFQRRVLKKQVLFDLDAANELYSNPDGSKIYLSDRCVTCYSAFASVYGPKFGIHNMHEYVLEESRTIETWVDAVTPLVAAGIATILYIEPHGGSIESDGVRPDNVTDQRIVSTIIRGILLHTLIDNAAISKVLFNSAAQQFTKLVRTDGTVSSEQYDEKLRDTFSNIATMCSQAWTNSIVSVGSASVDERFARVLDYLKKVEELDAQEEVGNE